MQKYMFLEHTADALFQAFGTDFKELAKNSAEAMCSVMYELEKVEPKEKIEVIVKGKNQEELLHKFLEEVLFEMQSKEIVFVKFEVKEVEGELKAVLWGEKMDPTKHGFKTDIKAVTWHEFFVKKERNKLVSQVLVDI